MGKVREEAPALTPHWFHILLSLADQDLHGLAIMNEVLERTDGQMRLWPAMLYRNLGRLVEDGLVVEVDTPPDTDLRGGRPRFYRITPLGRRACAREAERLARFVSEARRKRVLKA